MVRLRHLMRRSEVGPAVRPFEAFIASQPILNPFKSTMRAHDSEKNRFVRV